MMLIPPKHVPPTQNPTPHIDTVVWIDKLPSRLLVGRKYKLVGLQHSNIDLDSPDSKAESF